MNTTCNVENCRLHSAESSADIDALYDAYATPEFDYDREDGFTLCEALARSIERETERVSA